MKKSGIAPRRKAAGKISARRGQGSRKRLWPPPLFVSEDEKKKSSKFSFIQMLVEKILYILVHGVPEWIMDEEVEQTVCDYYSAAVCLCPDGFEKVNDGNDYRETVILHEFGHVLGLRHTTCYDVALMAKHVDDANASNSIEEHERYNVIKKYGQ